VIISEYILAETKPIQFEDAKLRPKRKKSFKVTNYKFKE
jgi:hypothetical protein